MPSSLCADGEVLQATDVDGTPPAVLLLHSLALDRSVWDPHVEPLRARADVIRCDLPGHGRSCPVAPATSIGAMADEVAAFLEARAPGPVVTVGLSLGGCVAQALAIRHPQHVRGLVLVDTTAWYGADAPEKWAQRAARAHEEGLAALADFQLDRWFSRDFRARHAALCERLLEVFCDNDLPSYEAVCRAMGDFDGRDHLDRITVPATVVVGEHDHATPVADATLLAERISGARLRIVEGASHLSPLERPDAFLEEVLALLDRVHATR